MALKTDDEDIRNVHFYMDIGGNGDYYINLMEYDAAGKPQRINFRLAMSGGNAPLEIKIRFASLFAAMESAGLNKHPGFDRLTALPTEGDKQKDVE